MGQTTTSTYNLAGNLASYTDANGASIQWEYDVMNRLIRSRLPDGSEETFTYTPTGKPASATHPDGTLRWTYDVRDRIVTATDGRGGEVSYTYDVEGNVVAIALPNGVIHYTYDAANRMTSVRDQAGAVIHYTYDENGGLQLITLPNGITTELLTNAEHQLVGVVNRDLGGSVRSSYTYELDAQGRRTRLEDHTGRTIEYGYDAVGQLTHESISDPIDGNRLIAYIYDPVGNRIHREDTATGITMYQYDANDRLISAGTTTYDYDDNGNLTAIHDGPNVTTLTYDVRNRLVQVDDGVHVVDYRYDMDGQLVGRTVDGQVRHFIVDKNRRWSKIFMEIQTIPGRSWDHPA